MGDRRRNSRLPGVRTAESRRMVRCVATRALLASTQDYNLEFGKKGEWDRSGRWIDAQCHSFSALLTHRNDSSAVVHRRLPGRHREGREGGMDEIKTSLIIPIVLNNV
jgi:hypothetical protein